MTSDTTALEDEELKNAVLALIEQNSQISILAIARTLALPKRAVEDAIEELVKQHIIVREGSPCCGNWSIADDNLKN